MSDPYIIVHPITVRGTKYEVKVTDNGDWVTQAGSEQIRAATRTGLKDKLTELSARAAVAIAIPFVLLTDSNYGRSGTVSRGLVTGIHAGNGNLMITWTTGWRAGKKTQWTPSYQDVVFGGDVTDEDVEQWRELRKVKAAATRELESFEQERKIQLRDRAVVAVQEAVSGNA